jgi:hypothetical protein
MKSALTQSQKHKPYWKGIIMAKIGIQDLLLCEKKDREAMNHFIGGASDQHLIATYYARRVGVGTYMDPQTYEIKQKFQDVYLKVYEEYVPVERSFIGPICDPYVGT